MNATTDSLFLERFWQHGTQAAGSLDWWKTPRFTTQSLSSAQDHIRAYDENADLTVSDPRAFESYRESFIQLGSLAVSVSSIQSNRGYDLSFRPKDEFCLNIPLRGRGWIANGPRFIEMGTDHAAFVSPACEVRKHWSGSSQVLTLHIPSAIFTDEHSVARLATLPGVVGVARERLRGLIGLLDLICREATCDDAPMLRGPAVRYMEHAAIALLLQALPLEDEKPRAAKPPPIAIPRYLARAEQYIRANWQTQLTLHGIADAVGVSTRSLQYGFKRFRGATPMKFVRSLRLDHAREMLASIALPPKTVNEVAADVGYISPSQFARSYKGKFGECPSETQARTSVVPF